MAPWIQASPSMLGPFPITPLILRMATNTLISHPFITTFNTSTEFRHPQSLPPHGPWPRYQYVYAHPYASPHHSGFAQPNAYTDYNQAQPPTTAPNTQPTIESRRTASATHTQLPPRLPNAQFGVDPARLAAPPQFSPPPFSEPTSEPTRPFPSPVVSSGSLAHQQSSLLGPQEMQPIVVTPPLAPSIQQPPSDQALRPLLQTTTPTSATGEALIIQQPPSIQNALNQVTTMLSGQQESIIVAGQVEEDEDDEGEDGQGPDEGHEQESGAATHSTQTQTASTRRFQATGKTTKSRLKEKWDAEARTKGYNPDKAASGANPWAGYVEGVGVGNEEDPCAFYRRNYLYPPISSQSDNTRTYNRWIGNMMTKVEDVSRRTGCVLYIIAHHPNSGKPFTWYASPKLRRKAPEALSEFHGLAAQAIIDINNAETGTKMGLVGELNRAKAQHKAALDEIQELKSRLQGEDKQQTEVTLTLGRLQGL